MTITDLDVGVLLLSATLSMGTRTLVSEKYVAAQVRGMGYGVGDDGELFGFAGVAFKQKRFLTPFPFDTFSFL